MVDRPAVHYFSSGITFDCDREMAARENRCAAHLPTVVVVSRHAPGKQPTARFHASQYKRYNKLCGWHDAHDDCANVISLSDYVGFGSVTNIRFGNYSVLATIPFHE